MHRPRTLKFSFDIPKTSGPSVSIPKPPCETPNAHNQKASGPSVSIPKPPCETPNAHNQKASGPSVSIPKPSCETPNAHNQKALAASKKKSRGVRYLFAGRRLPNPEGDRLELVDMKSGEKTIGNEMIFNSLKIRLGDLLSMKSTNQVLVQSKPNKKTISGMTTNVDENVASIVSVHGTLIEHQGHQVFQTELFANALNTGEKLPLGGYWLKISLLSEPVTLPDGSSLFLGGVNTSKPQNPEKQKNVPETKKKNMDEVIAANVKGTLIECQGHQVFKTELFENALNTGKRLKLGEYNIRICLLREPLILADGTSLILQATTSSKFLNGNLSRKNEKLDKIDKKKIRAVVTNFSKLNGTRTHYLWILDEQVEGVFRSPDYHLEKGHFFTGLFKYNAERGTWTCKKHVNTINEPFEVGLNENGFIWFKVKITSFEKASGDMKFSEAQAEYVGKIVDVYKKLTEDCEGKFVKIKTKRMALKVYVWCVVEVLPD